MYRYDRLSVIFVIFIPLLLHFGVIKLKKGIRNLKIAKGFRKDNLATTEGNLVSKKLLQNKHIGSSQFDSHWEKQWTQYHYTYNVNGKTYDISGGTPFNPKNISQRVEITYQKSAPEYAIIPDIFEPEYESTGDKQILGGCLLILLALIFLTFVLVDVFWQM